MRRSAKKIDTHIIGLLLMILIALPLAADQLYTVDGKVYDGKFVAFKYSTIFFNVYKFGKFHSSMRFPLYQVWKLEFNDPQNASLVSSFETEANYRKFRRGKRIKKISLPADQRWVNTGIQLQIGQDILFSISGSIQIDDNTKVFQNGKISPKLDARNPMPNQPVGAVIAKIGADGPPFYVGDDRAPFHVSRQGSLFMGINDHDLSDNNGEFSVIIYY
ncbi:MAG TPA: hypothetical protein ENN40_11030 [Candidatus Aminicenantes bacterium]|nr:hypothetical protein [Candidatus Aminicenantes bacterium]